MSWGKFAAWVGFIASILGVVGFLTGYQSLPQFMQEERKSVSTSDTSLNTGQSSVPDPGANQVTSQVAGSTSSQSQGLTPQVTLPPQPAVPPYKSPVITDEVIQTDHPYANKALQKFTVSRPGSSEIRLHFVKLELEPGDSLRLRTPTGSSLGSFGSSSNGQDFWTEHYAFDTLNLEFSSDSSETRYGFLIDKVEERYGQGPSADLPESHHPYANKITNKWTISRPGAKDIRLHFAKLELESGDAVRLKTASGQNLGYFGSSNDGIDIWTDFYQVDTMVIEFTSDSSGVRYGFQIDQVESR